MLFRYGLLAGEGVILATANHRTGLENLDMLARMEIGKLAVHYLNRGLKYFSDWGTKYIIQSRLDAQPITLGLSSSPTNYKD